MTEQRKQDSFLGDIVNAILLQSPFREKRESQYNFPADKDELLVLRDALESYAKKLDKSSTDAAYPVAKAHTTLLLLRISKLIGDTKDK